MKISIAILFLISSCQIIHLLNTKNPNNESAEEVNQFLKRKKILFNENLFLNDSLIELRKTKKYLLSDSNNIASYIEVRVFDSIGNLYTAFSQCYNDFKDKKFIYGMPINKNNYPFFNKNLKFENEILLTDITDIEKKRVILESQKYKYSIVVYWNIWTNHFSKKVLKDLSKLKQEYKNEIYLVLCNSAYNKIEK